MGTSGNRPGFKIFSFNTSVRNPKRNDDFLNAFIKFNGKLFDRTNSYAYLCELVKRGVYKFNIVPNSIKEKWNSNVDLNKEEIESLIEANPQATGDHNRVMTSYMRSLKDQGFLKYEEDDKNKKYHIIKISKLGRDMISNKNISIIYTKAMIGLHANNPSRTTMYNKSRPFLNTLFVINEVNSMWKKLGNEAKGILKHEFAIFVLGMKNCNYKLAAEQIIEYRKKYKNKVNMSFINEYLIQNGLQPLAEKSICNDYPDDVFRKFEMTELITKHGKFGNIYYNFSGYNLEKINSILKYYKDYTFKEFKSVDEYYEYQYNVHIPWENDEIIRTRIVNEKAERLGLVFKEETTLHEKEKKLNIFCSNKVLLKALEKYDFYLIEKELLILAGKIKEKTKFEDISEPLRLEYLLTLLIGKQYGTEGLISNIIYDENGEPLHCATAGKSDIVFHHKDGSYIIEVTLQTNKAQQTNNETTNILRHVDEETERYHTTHRVMMVAPYIHQDVLRYFRFEVKDGNAKILALNIDKTIELIDSNKEIKDLNENYDKILEKFKTSELKSFLDEINTFCFKIN